MSSLRERGGGEGKAKKVSLWRERERGLWAGDRPAPNSELEGGGKIAER